MNENMLFMFILFILSRTLIVDAKNNLGFTPLMKVKIILATPALKQYYHI